MTRLSLCVSLICIHVQAIEMSPFMTNDKSDNSDEFEFILHEFAQVDMMKRQGASLRNGNLMPFCRAMVTLCPAMAKMC